MDGSIEVSIEPADSKAVYLGANCWEYGGAKHENQAGIKRQTEAAATLVARG